MTRAFVCGCAGPRLSPIEAEFIAKAQPWGLILFKRNVETPDELRALAQEFRAAVGRADAPVLIDQEGGRVQRMKPPHWPAYPAATDFDAKISDPSRALRAAGLTARLIAHDLRKVGVTINCAPVLDVAEPGTHEVIGSRAYSSDPARVAEFGRVVCEAFKAGGVAPVVKHIPGHGRARVDSHLELPIVSASLAELEARDFAPFKQLRDMPMAMSAHVVYRAIDPDRPATTSAAVVASIMRGAIGFDGLILSDDLSMKALQGGFADRTRRVFAAGLDIALHCNGDLAEAGEVAGAAPLLSGIAMRRAEAALECVRAGPQPFNVEEARAQLQALMAAAA